MFRTLGLRHLVVVNHFNKVVGILTRADLVASHIYQRSKRLGLSRATSPSSSSATSTSSSSSFNSKSDSGGASFSSPLHSFSSPNSTRNNANSYNNNTNVSPERSPSSLKQPAANLLDDDSDHIELLNKNRY